MALSALERETIITMCDADDYVTVNTSQRTMVTQLLKNPQAEIVDDITHDGTRILTAKLPKNAITVRKGTKKRTAKQVADVNTCNGKKTNGEPCNMLSVGDTGYCRWHQDQK